MQLKVKRGGFTLIEVMLSIAILAILLSLGAPMFLSYIKRNDLAVAENILVHDLYRAQSQSRNSNSSDSWGVYVTNGGITLFRGASYSSRYPADDQRYELPSSITVSGTNEYVFSEFSGLPQNIGSTSLVSNNGDTASISLNSKGVVEH